MRRSVFATTAGIAALALVALGAAPASAAELPEANTLYPLTQEALYSATSTGASTYIADLPDQGDGKYGADFDVTTGKAYYFTDTDPDCSLYTLDPATGVSTFVGFVVSDLTDECDALNVALDGTLRVADQDGTMLTLDKATGAVLATVTITGIEAISFIDQTTTGVFYAGDYDGALYTLDVTTGVATFVAQPTEYFETASFDSADTLWFATGADSSCGYGLASLSLTDPVGSATYQGDYLDGDACLDAYALFIAQPAPPAQLAATGAAPAAAALAPFAVLALLAGGGALMLQRRSRTA